MGRALLLAVVLTALVACRPSGREASSGLIPPADAPATPTEPAAAPADAVAAPAAAKLAADPADALLGPLDLNGTEPFWSLKIRRDSLELKRPDRKDVLAVNPGPRTAAGQAVWDTLAVANGDPLRVTVEARGCSDGMSDKAYAYAATVELGGETLKGCAKPAAG